MPLFIGSQVMYFPELASTSTHAWELLPQRPPEGTVVWAGYQTAGRGQRGASWTAAAGENLTLSIILYPSFLRSDQGFSISQAVALGVRDTVQALAPGGAAQIKWPNDILLNRRKLAGILIENQWEGGRMKACVIGIGLNVNQVNFPDEIAGRASSLCRESGRPHSLQQAAGLLFDHVESYYLRLRAGDFEGVQASYLGQMAGYQQQIEARIGGERHSVYICGVDSWGRLCVERNHRPESYDVKEIQLELYA
jgi:BirA family biotin operon repressor/biotin-[acetyl-CoA-carboxylase] ligase